MMEFRRLLGLSALLLVAAPAVMMVSAHGKDTLQIRSPAFEGGAPIPMRHTCEGAQLSPPLSWSGAPAGVKSYLLLAEDPDAVGGNRVHWLLYNIAPEVTNLPEGVPPHKAGTWEQGLNDSQHPGYGGPCPPAGKAHRYFFRLFALDQPLELPTPTTRHGVVKAMQGHILAQADLMGLYKQKKAQGS